MQKILTFFAAAALVAGCASTQERITPEDPLAVDVAEFHQEQQRLRANLEDGVPRQLREQEWREFDRIQKQFAEMLADVESVDELSINQKLTVYNLQEDLAVLLADDVGDNRVYCTRTRRTGTNIATTSCRSRQELARERERTQDNLREIRHRDRGAPPPDN